MLARLHHTLLLRNVTESDSSAETSAPSPNSHRNNNKITTTSTTSSNSDGRWDSMFQGLVAYKRQHKTLKVTRTATWNNQSLYEWVRNNRKHYLNRLKHKTPALSAQRVAALQSIDFNFDPTGVLGSNDAFDDKRWACMFGGLVAYKERYGNFSVPVGYVCDGRSLLDWIRHQRSQYTNSLTGQRPALSMDRRERLASIGFDFDPTGQRQDRRSEQERWNVMLNGLQEYYQRHGTFVLSEGYLHDNRSLFSWARNQRRLYLAYLQGLKPALSEDRLDRLRDIGFIQARCAGVKGGKVAVVAAAACINKSRKVSKIKITATQGQRRLMTARRQLPTTRRYPIMSTASSSEGSSSDSSGSFESSDAQTPIQQPSWVVSLAMNSLAKYQEMSPKERRHMVSL